MTAAPFAAAAIEPAIERHEPPPCQRLLPDAMLRHLPP
jgi:hypothetical protein